MNLYIDKENLRSIILHALDNRMEYNQCEQIFANQLAVHYNFPKEELLSEDYGDWIYVIEQSKNCSFAETTKEIIPNREDIKSNFYKKLPEFFFALYFINEPRIVNSVKDKNSVVISLPGEEINTLLELCQLDSEVLACNIQSWESYIPNTPVSDVMIIDEHYFKHKDVYETNANQLIAAISKIPNQSPIHIVLITKKGEIDSSIKLEEEQKKLEELVKKASNSSKSTVAIYTSYKVHDRAVVTNYYRIKNGSCFQLKNNGLKGDVTTEIKSHIYRQNEEISIALIKFYREIINNSSEQYGSTNTNFLLFPE